MKGLNKFWVVLRLCTIVMVLMGAIFPAGATTALAQDITPPPSDPAPAADAPAPAADAPAADAPAVDAPAADAPAPAATDPAVVEPAAVEPAAPDATAVPVETQAAPAADAPAPAAADAPAPTPTEVAEVTQAIADNNMAVSDESRNTLSMADQNVAEALTSSDPYFTGTVAGQTGVHGYSTNGVCPAVVQYCHTSATPLTAAISASPAGAEIFVEAGSYTINSGSAINRTLTLNGGVSLTNSNGGNAIFNVINLLGANITNATNNIFANIVNIFSGASIQTGINFTNTGGTANVGPGTFNVSAPINVNKRITLRGLTGDNTPGAAVGAPVLNRTGGTTAINLTAKGAIVEGFVIKGFQNGVLVNLSSHSGSSETLIANNTFLNNSVYDVKVINDSRDVHVNYNAFLDLDSNGNPLPFGSHQSYALYQGNSGNYYVFTKGNYWGCGSSDASTPGCGPVGYSETDHDGIVSQPLQHTGQINFYYPGGNNNTYRQGIVLSEDGNHNNSKVTIECAGSTYTCTKANQTANSSGQCVCSSGYEDWQGECVPVCPNGTRNPTTGLCPVSCPQGQIDNGSNVCVCENGSILPGCVICSTGTSWNATAQACTCDNGSTNPGCVVCDANEEFSNGQCVCSAGYESVSGACVPVCDTNETRNSDGVCVCSAGYESVSGSCVPVCPVGTQRNSDGVCQCPDGSAVGSGGCPVYSCSDPAADNNGESSMTGPVACSYSCQD